MRVGSTLVQIRQVTKLGAALPRFSAYAMPHFHAKPGNLATTFCIDLGTLGAYSSVPARLQLRHWELSRIQRQLISAAS
jgi:hypothetical protein